MSRSIVALIAAQMLALAIAAPAICEDLVGTVADRGGQVVQGVKIIAQSKDGTTQAATTDANGQYRLAGLDPGQYLITLDPAGNGVQGQTVAGYVGNSGLTVNWSVASGVSALASAQPGIQPSSSRSLGAAGSVVTANNVSVPPGCEVNGGTKRTDGFPCGPKKSKKRGDD